MHERHDWGGLSSQAERTGQDGRPMIVLNGSIPRRLTLFGSWKLLWRLCGDLGCVIGGALRKLFHLDPSFAISLNFFACLWRHVQDHMKTLQGLISNDYRVHMQLDNLPVAIRIEERWVFPCLPLWREVVWCPVRSWYSIEIERKNDTESVQSSDIAR